MIKKVSRNELRKQRHYRVRAKVTGTAERPRLMFSALANTFMRKSLTM